MNDCDLDLEYKECTSIREATIIGECSPSMDYHVLLKRNKIILVMHYFWQKCNFCHLENEDGVCTLDD